MCLKLLIQRTSAFTCAMLKIYGDHERPICTWHFLEEADAMGVASWDLLSRP